MENVSVVFFPYAGGSSFCYQQIVYGFGENKSIFTIDYARLCWSWEKVQGPIKCKS